MSNQQSRSALVKGKLILNINKERATGDPFKFTPSFLAEFSGDVSALDEADMKVGSERGSDASASPKVRAAKDEIGKLLREGYRAIAGVPSFQLSAADKQEVFEIYGWRNGEIGTLDDNRILEMADDVIDISEQDPPPAFVYPAQLVALIQAQINIIDGQESESDGGDGQSAVGIRNTKLAKLTRSIMRARFFYYYASDLADRTPELVKIGFQPRRSPTRKKADATPANTAAVNPTPAP